MNAFLANLYLRAIAVRDREEGQTMAEYGIILALIAVVCIVAVGASRRPRSTRALDSAAASKTRRESGGGISHRENPTTISSMHSFQSITDSREKGTTS